jgi:hypothetical protein
MVRGRAHRGGLVAAAACLIATCVIATPVASAQTGSTSQYQAQSTPQGTGPVGGGGAGGTGGGPSQGTGGQGSTQPGSAGEVVQSGSGGTLPFTGYPLTALIWIVLAFIGLGLCVRLGAAGFQAIRRL